jgi:hypothetical protein
VEKAPLPIGKAQQWRHRKPSLPEARHQRDSNQVSDLKKAPASSYFQPATNDANKNKKEKSTSWELPQMFKRRRTLEKEKHKSTPALRIRTRTWESTPQDDIPPLPVQTPWSAAASSQAGLDPRFTEDLLMCSPLRSEFSDDSDSEVDGNVDTGKMVKLVRRVRKKFQGKR